MFARARPHTIAHRSPGRQRGVILLLIVLSMLAILGVMFLGTLGQSASQRAQVQQVSGAQTLVAAKQALIGYAVSRVLPATNGRIGRLPQPDTLGTNGKYDGVSDSTSCLDGNAANGMPALSLSPATQVANLRCLGRLPWSDLGLSIDGASDRDVLGLVPWYAVSPNFADPTPGNGECVTILNAVTMAGSPTSFTCPTSTGPAWPWMKVCDNTGRIVSSRVAFVVILPGEAITTTGRDQLRTTTATGSNPNGYGNPSDFLDALPTPTGWSSLAASERCNTFDNANLSGEFIVADRSSVFNDQVIYVTVDELMVEVEKRVAASVREALIAYKSSTGGYPWLATLANPTAISTATLAVPGTLSGFVPFATPPSETSQKFLTELGWRITTTGGADNYATPTTSSPTFFCYSGTYQCRLRTTANAAIPRTITTAAFGALKISSIPAPAANCSYTFDMTTKTVNCDLYTYSQPTSVSYRVDRRPCSTAYSAGTCSGTRVFIANYIGTQTRSISVGFSPIQGSGSPSIVAATASTTASRTVTSNPITLDFILATQDSWVPSGVGVAPFDVSSGPFLPWAANTLGTGTVALTFRVLPELPSWYFTQKWYEQVYGAISADSTPASGTSVSCSSNCFSSGARSGLDVIIISAGPQIASQNRYVATPLISDFLEAPNSTGVSTRAFAASTASRTTTYADVVTTFPR